MEYRQLGRTGLRVSPICLGAMTFGQTEGFMSGVACDEETSRQIMNAALDAGCNFIDTADVYGNGLSEEITGRWLKDHRREIVLATKVRFTMGPGTNDKGLSRKHIMDGVHDSLRRLGTDYIDLMQVHMQDRHTPIDETLRALDDLVRQGKVLYLGASNYTAYRLMESLWVADKLNTARYDCLQPQYSLLCRDIEREILPACVAHGIGVIPWSPLAGGVLTGKYARGSAPPEGSRMAKWEDSWKRHDNERTYAILDVVNEVAKETESSAAQVSLAWLLAQPGVTSAIIGARSTRHIADNFASADLKLSDEQLERLSTVSKFEGGLGYPYGFIRNVDGGF